MDSQYSFRQSNVGSAQLFSGRARYKEVLLEKKTNQSENKIDEIRKKYQSPLYRAQSHQSFNTNRSKKSLNYERQQGNSSRRNHNLPPSQVPRINKKYQQNIKPTKQQQQLIKKLFHIKQSYSDIPNWQKHAKKILFDQTSGVQTPKYGLQNIINTKPNMTLERKSFNILGLQVGQNIDLKKQEQIPKYKIPQKIKQQQKNYPQVVDKYQDDDLGQPIVRNQNKIQIKQVNSIRQTTKNKSSNKSKQIQVEDFKVQDKVLKKNHSKRQVRHVNSQKKDSTIDVDQKINSIQNKIKQFQEKKKKLNIQYVPFKKNINHNHSVSDFDKLRPKTSYKAPQIKQLDNSMSKGKKSSSKPPKHDLRSSKSKKNIKQSPKFSKMVNKIKLQTSQSNQIVFSKQTKTDSEFNQMYNQNIGKKKHPSQYQNRNYFQFYEEKKNQYPGNKNYYMYDLVDVLSQQIKLDENLRNDKLWLQICRKQKKFDRIKSQLEFQNISMATEEIERQFTVTEDENNPFYSVRENESDIDHVVDSYIKSQRHWKNQVYKKFEKKKLIETNFSLKTIDLDKKGYISLQDLVRFMNLQTGTFFRNRDLALIFRRLTNTNKLKFQELISIISF